MMSGGHPQTLSREPRFPAPSWATMTPFCLWPLGCSKDRVVNWPNRSGYPKPLEATDGRPPIHVNLRHNGAWRPFPEEGHQTIQRLAIALCLHQHRTPVRHIEGVAHKLKPPGVPLHVAPEIDSLDQPPHQRPEGSLLGRGYSSSSSRGLRGLRTTSGSGVGATI